MENSSKQNIKKAPFLLLKDPISVKGLGSVKLNFDLSKHILKIAIPVVIGMVTQTAINILDTIMVGYLPKEEANLGQAAIGISLPFIWLIGGSLSSIWVGTQAITSRRKGEGHLLKAGKVLSNSLFLALILSIFISLIIFFLTPTIISSLYSDPKLVFYATKYLQIRYLGIVAMVTTFSFKSFFDGIGKTKIFMFTSLFMNLMNAFLNYILIFGYPPLSIESKGVIGAAWASVISANLGLLILFFWSFSPKYLKHYNYYKLLNINKKTLKEIITLSFPNAVATLVIMLGVCIFNWVVGVVNDLNTTIGNPVIVTANQLVITCALPCLIASMGFGSATASIVSQTLGAGRTFLAERYGFEALKLWSYIMLILGFLMFLFTEEILGFTTNDPQVIEIGKTPLQLLAIFYSVIAIAMVMGQTLHGLGNSSYLMKIEFILHIFVMSPFAYIFGVVLNLGIVGIWVGPLIYVSILAIITMYKFYGGDWKGIKI